MSRALKDRIEVHPIYTLTANLLWETTFTCGQWNAGETIRANTFSIQVGGKGLNVSKMLDRLSAKNEAIIFPGGETGRLCVKWLQENHFSTRCFFTQSETRTGLVVRSTHHPETTFLGPDCHLDREALERCIAYLDAIPEGGILAICGGIAQWETPLFDSFRAKFPSLIKRHTVVIDTYGAPLAWFARQPVALIKVNAREFEGLQSPAPSPSSPRESILEVAKKGKPKHWVITDGPNPVRAIDPDGNYTETTPPPVTEVSAVGSGDVFFACVLHALFDRSMNLADAIDYALPFAAANTTSPGIADFDIPLRK